MNAIATHFLEDFFAPGHVITPRTGLHDYSALAMHDHYNRVGARFAIENGEALARLLDPERDADRLNLTPDRLRQIRARIAANSELALRGDGFLRGVLLGERTGAKADTLHPEAQEQAVLMTLVVARSIVDVFQALTCKEYVNELPEYLWQPMHRFKDDEPRQLTADGQRAKIRLAAGGLPFGRYVDQNVRRLNYGWIMPLEFSVQSAPWAEQESVRGIASAFLIPTFLCDACSPVPGSFAGGSYHPRLWSPTLGVGLLYRLDEELPGWGVFVRGGLLFQRLDLHVALGLGLERYSWSGAESWRFHPELRAGVGRSFINYILAVGYDHGLDAGRRLEGAVVFRAGVTVGIPWGKLVTLAARR
jgi:hypothetical protein